MSLVNKKSDCDELTKTLKKTIKKKDKIIKRFIKKIKY